MKETRLWDHLRPTFDSAGKFYKTCDRFTEGVPDVLGLATGPTPIYLGTRRISRDQPIPYAFELKEFEGVRSWKVKFRPLQLDWLRDWEKAGGRSWVVASHGVEV